MPTSRVMIGFRSGWPTGGKLRRKRWPSTAYRIWPPYMLTCNPCGPWSAAMRVACDRANGFTPWVILGVSRAPPPAELSSEAGRTRPCVKPGSSSRGREMKPERAQDALDRELLTWEGVESRAHRFGGREYRLGGPGFGHGHGGGRIDLPPP